MVKLENKDFIFRNVFGVKTNFRIIRPYITLEKCAFHLLLRVDAHFMVKPHIKYYKFNFFTSKYVHIEKKLETFFFHIVILFNS